MFQPQNWSRVSKSANEDVVDIQDVVKIDTSTQARLKVDCQGCFREYNYFSKTYTGNPAVATGDSLGNILTWPLVIPTGATSPTGVGYFDQVVNDLQPGDIINVYSYLDSAYIKFTVVAVNCSSPRVILSPLTTAKGSEYFPSSQITSMGLVTSASPIILIGGGLNYIVGLNSLTASIAAVPGGSLTVAAYGAGANLNVQYMAIPNKANTALNATNAISSATLASTALTSGNASCTVFPGTTLTTANIGVPGAGSLAGYNIQLGTATAFTMAAGKTGNPLILSYDYTIYPLM